MKVFFFNDIYAKTTSQMSLALITSDGIWDQSSHQQT